MEIIRIVSAAYRHFVNSDGWAMASHIALSIMMALFPFMIFSASLASFLGGPIKTEDLTELLFEFWPEQIAEPIAREVNIVLSSSSVGLMTFSIILTLFFASNGVEAVRTALNRAYQDDDKRSVWRQRIQSILFVLVGGVLMIAVSFILVFVPAIRSMQRHLNETSLQLLPTNETISKFVAFALLSFVVFACHRWLPGNRRSLARLLTGIIVTLVFWTISTQLFSLYLKSVANYSATYAGLAGVMSAQIFLYLISVVLIFGAEINAAVWKFKTKQHT